MLIVVGAQDALIDVVTKKYIRYVLLLLQDGGMNFANLTIKKKGEEEMKLRCTIWGVCKGQTLVWIVSMSII